jgi:hypothetical protein
MNHEGPNACAHKGCKCSVQSDAAAKSEGLLFCTERCADGRGCDHEGCNCGSFPAPEPEPER